MKTLASFIAALALGLTSLSALAGAPPAGPKPVCEKGMTPKLEMGHWQCKPFDLTAAPSTDPTASTNPGGGAKPTCPKAKLPKLENGVWLCKDPDLTAKPGGEALLLPAVQSAREAPHRTKNLSQ